MDMRDIAKLAGVSSATVSRVINGSSLVRPETIERVRKVIEEAKFFPNSSATTLKSGRSGTYGLIIPDITNPFFPEFIKCFEEIVVENDQEMLMDTTDFHSGRMQQSIRRMLIRRVDGVALLASEIETGPFEDLIHNRVPLVTMGRGHTAKGLSDVAINNKSGMDQALRHLKELRHKKVRLYRRLRRHHDFRSSRPGIYSCAQARRYRAAAGVHQGRELPDFGRYGSHDRVAFLGRSTHRSSSGE